MKIAGVAPRATSFYIANSSGTSYSRANNENKHLVMCVNQLSGTGRYRSQFRPNADGNRGTFCIKPLLSIFAYKPGYAPRGVLCIYVNKLNTEILVNDFGFYYNADLSMYESSANNYNINFGGTQLDMCSNTVVTYTNISNTNCGFFIIRNFISSKNFSNETYQYLRSLKPINTINDDNNENIPLSLLSGYSFTITTKSNPVKSLTFNSLTNENYYYLLKNNNWYKILLIYQ